MLIKQLLPILSLGDYHSPLHPARNVYASPVVYKNFTIYLNRQENFNTYINSQNNFEIYLNKQGNFDVFIEGQFHSTIYINQVKSVNVYAG